MIPFEYTLILNLTFNFSGKEALENIVGKGENAGNQHFLLFPHVLPYNRKIASSEPY